MVGFHIVRLRIARSGGDIGDTVVPDLEVIDAEAGDQGEHRERASATHGGF
jgi:hypothetical protein